MISAARNAEDAKELEYAYRYDDIGNRISSFDLGTNRTYIANNLNQYTQISNLCDSASLREEFLPQFDDDGNQTLIQTATGIWQVQYNGENRPILWQCISTNSSASNLTTPTLISMSYDRMGRRVTKNDQRFVYDGYLQVADNSGNIYIWDSTESIATRPLVWNHSALNYYTHDGNKNVSEAIASDGSLAAHYEYAAFGDAVMVSGEKAQLNPFRFSSEYADDALGLAYYNYRHLDHAAGRWLQRDPLEYDCVNLYVYCYNRFTGCIDRLGRESSLLDGLSWEVNYCCLNGNVICRDPVDTGVTVHKLYDRDWYEWGARIIRPFTPNQRKLTHAWFEVVGDCEIFTFGAYPNTDARMGVISPDPHAPDSSNPNTQSETIKLSPCDYDIAAFTTCVLSAKDENFDWTFWSNCGDFVDGTVARCKSASERK